MQLTEDGALAWADRWVHPAQLQGVLGSAWGARLQRLELDLAARDEAIDTCLGSGAVAVLLGQLPSLRELCIWAYGHEDTRQNKWTELNDSVAVALSQLPHLTNFTFLGSMSLTRAHALPALQRLVVSGCYYWDGSC